MSHHILLENLAARNAIDSMGLDAFDAGLKRVTKGVFGETLREDLLDGQVIIDHHLPWDTSPVDLVIMIAAVNKPVRRQYIVRLQHKIAERVTRMVLDATGAKLNIEVHINLIGTLRMELINQRASEQAGLLLHTYVGTEHLLVALLTLSDIDFPFLRQLERLEITHERVRQEIEEIVGLGGGSVVGEPAQTPNYQKVLRLVAEQIDLDELTMAQRVFLALLDVDEGGAARIMVKVTETSLPDLRSIFT